MPSSIIRFICCTAAVLTFSVVAPAPGRADFFSDVRRTFQTDIPHFFQVVIPCAFCGKPTSHNRTSCKSPTQPAKHTKTNAHHHVTAAHHHVTAPPKVDKTGD